MKDLKAYCKRIKIISQKESTLPNDGFVCIKQDNNSNKLLIMSENSSIKAEFEVFFYLTIVEFKIYQIISFW